MHDSKTPRSLKEQERDKGPSKQEILKGYKQVWTKDCGNLKLGDRIGVNRFIARKYNCSTGVVDSEFQLLPLEDDPLPFAPPSCGYYIKFDNDVRTETYINPIHIWKIVFVKRTWRNLFGLLI